MACDTRFNKLRYALSQVPEIPWHVDYILDVAYVTGPVGEDVVAPDLGAASTEIAEYIAQADPIVIGALLEERDELREYIVGLLEMLEHVTCESGECCCGEPVEGHGVQGYGGSDHTPVDSGTYYMRQAVQEGWEIINRYKPKEG